ncbi:MAG: PBP1A family penicillin-binding protein [Patescibacteria group bacterium]
MERKNSKRQNKEILKNGLIIATIVLLFSLGSVIFWVSTFKIPSLDSFEQRKVAESTKIYDRTGKVLLYDVFQNIKRTVVPFEEISRHIKNATIAIEDKEFYEHNGIKPTAFLRAVLVNLQKGEFSQGGSTITQQVVKNSLLTNEKSVSRKLKEWLLALRLEKELDKETILSMYLNEIPYGGSLYGIEEASQTFFGKRASELTLPEAAYMAALPKAPSYYSPYGNHLEELEKRKNLVLNEMLRSGFITEEENAQAKEAEVEFKPQEEKGIKAPHFVMFVKDYLEKKYGQEVLERGGLRVVTTLDYEMQKKGEEITKKFALENKEKFNAENAALIAINPKTGEILTMVGSRDYFDTEIDGNFNVGTAFNRQPGSAFKPFAYAEAFKKGYMPETALFDLETEFSTLCDSEGNPINPSQKKEDVCYSPVNYDGIFRGPLTMREALAQSINVPSVKTLYLAGMNDTLTLAKDMGITSLTDIGRYGLTLVLGGGEVSLLEMTNAYGVFANDGIKNHYQSIIEIREKGGNILEINKKNEERVLPSEIARKISDVLSDNKARAPAFGETSYLYFPNREVAVKTGTTNDYRDAWIIGYTPSIAVGAWAGNNDNSPMEKKVAGFIIAPLWNAFMQEVLATIPNESFVRPQQIDPEVFYLIKPVLRGKWQGGTSFPIDKISGKIATPYTPIETQGEVLTGGIHSILYWVDKNNPQGPSPATPADDPQFVRWEYKVREWVLSHNIIESNETIIPQTFDDIHKPEFEPKISIINPLWGKQYELQEKVLVSINYSGRYPLMKIEYYLNGIYIGNSMKEPFVFFFVPQEFNYIKQTNELKVLVYDSVFNKTESSLIFEVKQN